MNTDFDKLCAEKPKMATPISIFNDFVNRSVATIKRLEKRIEELELAPKMSYRGVWQPNTNYFPGDVTTRDGSMWHANIPTQAVPGTSTAWTLCVKQGRPGRAR